MHSAMLRCDSLSLVVDFMSNCVNMMISGTIIIPLKTFFRRICEPFRYVLFMQISLHKDRMNGMYLMSGLYVSTCGSAVSALFLCSVLRSKLYDYNKKGFTLKEGSKCKDDLLLWHVILEARGKQDPAAIPGT